MPRAGIRADGAGSRRHLPSLCAGIWTAAATRPRQLHTPAHAAKFGSAGYPAHPYNQRPPATFRISYPPFTTTTSSIDAAHQGRVSPEEVF
ncbi:hypothetical protein CHLRE_12g488152v5 [Chlamydomonas reinhardtii]|uniref:Uncharacterized protein n=1 Tax=Chlamydomonas reinhardtii TaxID=3055 RepID=A0A2K3D2A4_CHLRE|nr:uncharacterized protein CHLRE_12g488152v5 [Chlamydomonas reinhardtii]PNW74661.1 hypothetical protein CHLRE_12g488152v5 [Chlamydomonas reinhardtii]